MHHLISLTPCRPYVFTNLFQSAPAVASYVANALEAGTPWPRIERFFLSSVEVDQGISAIRVQVKGRLGEIFKTERFLLLGDLLGIFASKGSKGACILACNHAN